MSRRNPDLPDAYYDAKDWASKLDALNAAKPTPAWVHDVLRALSGRTDEVYAKPTRRSVRGDDAWGEP